MTRALSRVGSGRREEEEMLVSMSDMWIAPEQDPRTDGDPVGELATYREYLANYRLTIEMKCDGLCTRPAGAPGRCRPAR